MSNIIDDFIESIINNSRNNRLTNVKSIKRINKFYRNHREKSIENNLGFNAFIESMDEDLSKIVSEFQSVRAALERNYTSKALQPSIITECLIIELMAKVFSMNIFIDVKNLKENEEHYALVEEILKCVGEEHQTTKARFAFYNAKTKCGLIHYGDPNSVDCVFFKNNGQGDFKQEDIIKIEIKEKVSKLEEKDITGGYDEDGSLLISDKFKKESSVYIPIIEQVNLDVNVFCHIGKNVKLEGKYLSKDICQEIIKHKIIKSDAELFIFQEKEDITLILAKELLERMNFGGSEIRFAGRNKAKIFTPKYVEKVIACKGGTIKDGYLIIPKSEVLPGKKRGYNKLGRYKINSYLFFYPKDAVDKGDGTFRVKYSNIFQLKPTIALHLKVKNT